MATDQLFSQLLPQNQATGIFPDNLRTSDSAHPAELKTNGGPNKAETEGFLSILKRVLQSTDRTKKSALIGLAKQAEIKAHGLEDNLNEPSEATVVQNEDMTAPAQPLGKNKPEQDGPTPVVQNFMDIFKDLEVLGMHCLDEGSDGAKPVADPSKSKAEKACWRDTKIAGRIETTQETPAGRESRLPNNYEPLLDGRSAKHSAQAGVKPDTGSPSNGFSPTTAVEEPVSKVAQESQDLNDGHVKVPDGMKEETGGKAAKAEIGTNDTGLLNSQNPLPEKSTESVSLSKELDPDRNGLKTQTLDQIVHKAAIHLKNGQHEVRIDLKPEYLGHIRLQVSTENQQVTVKILTEHGFVKDMIENNAHQLKADLQQQGLHIDKLEVTVSRDSDDSGNSKERFAGMKARQGAADHGKQGNSGQDPTRNKRQWRRIPGGATMVDYFA